MPRLGSVDTTTCFHHTDRPTGRACTRCGRPACADCLHEASVGSHCFECIRAGRPPAAQRRRQWLSTAGPVVTKVIVAVNVVVYVLTVMNGRGDLNGDGWLQGQLALFGPAIEYGAWWELYRLVTAGFIHFGPLHIVFNLLILYQFGQMLEPALGAARMVSLYVASLLTGSFGALLLSPHAFTGGASGAVYGLLGAAAIGLHQRGVNIWQSGVGGLLVLNLLMTFVIPGISIGGHLGGLSGGFVVGAFMLRVSTTRRSVIDGVLVAAIVSALAVAGSVLIAR